MLAGVNTPLPAPAPRIAQPTLLVAAEKDDITPIEAERTLARLEDELAVALGAARAAMLCRALAYAQDLARSLAWD